MWALARKDPPPDVATMLKALQSCMTTKELATRLCLPDVASLREWRRGISRPNPIVTNAIVAIYRENLDG